MNTCKLLLIALLINYGYLSAQTTSDTLRMVKQGGIKFYQGSRQLRPAEVLQLMESNPAARAAFKKAKSNYDAAVALGYIGGFMIGWPVGTAIGGGDPNWGLAAGGVGVVLLSIPFNSAFKNHARSAVNLYNKNSPGRGASVQLMPAGAGMKLIVRF